jgi:hypothetical protein
MEIFVQNCFALVTIWQIFNKTFFGPNLQFCVIKLCVNNKLTLQLVLHRLRACGVRHNSQMLDQGILKGEVSLYH